jgi:tetratricopeptide (TPR) repeat protein
MRPISSLGCVLILLGVVGLRNVAYGADDRPAAPSADTTLRSACEYGIARAFAGEIAKAESAFVWILGAAPRDSRALTNLGNLKLMSGDYELALAFYASAEASDTTDAGVLLNQATTHLLLGEDAAASERAGLAIERAGGTREAARLVGLRVPGEEPPKAAAKTRITQDQILNMLRAAATGVPADSLRQRGSARPKDGAPSRRVPHWRTAGARAGDQEVASVLYWKR